MAPLQTDYGSQYENTLENQASNNLNFWENQLAENNPTAPVYTSQNTSPLYDQATNAALGFAQNALGSSGNSGNFDLGSFLRNMSNQENMLSNSANLGNELSNFYNNANTGLQYGAQNVEKMGEEGNISNLTGYQLPTQRAEGQMSTQDFINSLQNAYNNSQGGLGNIIGGGVGKILGDLAGNALNGDNSDEDSNDLLPASSPYSVGNYYAALQNSPYTGLFDDPSLTMAGYEPLQ